MNVSFILPSIEVPKTFDQLKEAVNKNYNIPVIFAEEQQSGIRSAYCQQNEAAVGCIPTTSPCNAQDPDSIGENCINYMSSIHQAIGGEGDLADIFTN